MISLIVFLLNLYQTSNKLSRIHIFEVCLSIVSDKIFKDQCLVLIHSSLSLSFSFSFNLKLELRKKFVNRSDLEKPKIDFYSYMYMYVPAQPVQFHRHRCSLRAILLNFFGIIIKKANGRTI